MVLVERGRVDSGRGRELARAGMSGHLHRTGTWSLPKSSAH